MERRLPGSKKSETSCYRGMQASKLEMRGGVEYDFSGEQKHRSYRGVGSASLSSFIQSLMPVFRAPGFKRTEGSGEEDV